VASPIRCTDATGEPAVGGRPHCNASAAGHGKRNRWCSTRCTARPAARHRDPSRNDTSKTGRSYRSETPVGVL